MITFDDVKKMSHKISLENGISDNDLSENVSEIVYRIDVFECDDAPIIDRHIDIEYSFGDYYEVHEENPIFQFIPASNEPSGRACTASWRMPRGSNTPLLCSVASLIPRCLQRGI